MKLRMNAAPNLFVWCKGEPDAAVGDRISQQVVGGRHNDRDAGLVVGAEQRRAARRHDVVADFCCHVRELLWRQHDARIVGQHEFSAGVIAMNDRLHAGGVELRRGIHVGQKCDRRRV